MDLSLGIVIPTLQEQAWLPGCLDSLMGCQSPILVVDGGSSDGTTEIAMKHPIKPQVLTIMGGRHQQLQMALKHLSTTWVLVLPADGRLLPGADERIAKSCLGLAGATACLQMRPDVVSWYHRVRATWSEMRSRLTGGAYLDQAPLFHRSSAIAVGGFRDCGPYDSAELGRRLRHLGRMVVLAEPVLISCREYQQRGFCGATLYHQAVRGRHMLSRRTTHE